MADGRIACEPHHELGGQPGVGVGAEEGGIRGLATKVTVGTVQHAVEGNTRKYKEARHAEMYILK